MDEGEISKRILDFTSWQGCWSLALKMSFYEEREWKCWDFEKDCKHGWTDLNTERFGHQQQCSKCGLVRKYREKEAWEK
eukprot:g47078.t1